MNQPITLAFFASTVLLTGCLTVPQRQPSAEEVQLQQQFIRAMLARQSDALNPQRQAPESEALPALVTEDELAERIARLPAVSGGVAFEGRKDGFTYNGTRFVDAEGQIASFGADYSTGDVTYLAGLGGNRFAVKFVRVGTSAEPISIASASHQNGQWTVKTASGKTLTGEKLVMASRGFLVSRTAAAFLYEPGRGVQNFATPDEFMMAAFQNGNIAGTGFILAERQQDTSQAAGLLNSVKSIGNTLGLNKKEDYALVNLRNGKVVPIDITVDGKNVTTGARCDSSSAKMGGAVNVHKGCTDFTFAESLYNVDGTRNGRHYYWRIHWFATRTGPYLIAQENGLRNITITHLETGRKVLAFSRTLGIAGFTTTQDTGGKVSIKAQLGFSSESIDDIETFFAAAPAIES